MISANQHRNAKNNLRHGTHKTTLKRKGRIEKKRNEKKDHDTIIMNREDVETTWQSNGNKHKRKEKQERVSQKTMTISI